MKKILLCALFLFLLPLPNTVRAHTLKIDGSIGVNLHVDPDDAPIALQESKFLIDIQDTSGRFVENNPENCICTLTIKNMDTVLIEMPIVTKGVYNQLRFTFPASGLYKVSIDGKTNGKGIAFQTFHTEFEYYVSSGEMKSEMVTIDDSPLLIWFPYLVAVVGSVLILMFVL